MEAQKFGKTCGSDVVASTSQVPVLLTQTKYVKEFIYVDGILVIILPPWIWGPIVDINIGIDMWSPVFITTIIQNWINVWNVVNINIACGPTPMIKPIHSSPPPAPLPPGRRTELPPTINPAGNPGGHLRPIDPPNLRPFPTKPITPVAVRPIATGPANPVFNPSGFRPTRPSKPINYGSPINPSARSFSNTPSTVSSRGGVKPRGAQQLAGPNKTIGRKSFM